MHKALILSLLLLLVPVSGQAIQAERETFYTHLIRSVGWKCDEVSTWHPGRHPTASASIREIECKNGKVYYLRNFPKGESFSKSLCHKGVCKELQ